MLLSAITEKTIRVGDTTHGVCRGVGLSLKSHAVKYLLCSSLSTQTTPDFAVGVSAVSKIAENVTLSRLRAVYPKSCAKITLGAPVYSFEGGYLGKVADLEMRDFVATRLFTDRNEIFPVTALFACSDAVILKKEQPYPLGQRIPAPMLSLVTDKKDSVVTKPILRTAIEKGTLIGFTLSLPPFALELDPPRA